MRKKRVVVAMSGGVDSSVAAALLKKQGFDVIGVFMRFWLARRSLGEGGDGYNRCCSPEAEERARQVARILGIPFYVFDFRKEFKKEVVDYFIREYRAGRTPNPCVVCNKEIKFGLLLRRALAMEADFIATGHYIRLNRGRIFEAKDRQKDQSYFLWQLSKKELRRCLFPLGGYTKTEVRQLAKRFKLPVASTPDSQEVCFVQTDITDFFKRYIKQKSGKIVDVTGRVLGQHRGLAVYTIGQRKGMELPQGPYWVVGKDTKKNVLVVTNNEDDLLQKELTFENANWIAGQPPKFPAKVRAKIRYRSQPAPATIYENQRMVFQKPQRAVTPGQSAVCYKGPELLGGGVICS
ncbi:MAG: tRNA 2-thiouridine(34) synthase MnmA [Candidatus Nealsonbacteria bacterium]|nr:tRNA 2-thiouridine(34) synthase MnmA [Candidatus Nealsonbacteria bacterium]